MSKKTQSRKTKRQHSTTQRQSISRTVAAEEFNPDYSQTIKDLKRIGMLAGSFFVILVVLSLFLA
jgi:hypothetical protein